MALISDSITGLDALKELLTERLGETETLLAFTPYGGVKAVKSEDEERHEGVPRIILEIETDEPAPDWGHTARRCVIIASVNVSDFAGALIGTTNPATADSQLSQFLQQVKRDYDLFNSAGLWGIEISGPREGKKATDDGPGSLNVHRITFYYDPEET